MASKNVDRLRLIATTLSCDGNPLEISMEIGHEVGAKKWGRGERVRGFKENILRGPQLWEGPLWEALNFPEVPFLLLSPFIFLLKPIPNN